MQAFISKVSWGYVLNIQHTVESCALEAGLRWSPLPAWKLNHIIWFVSDDLLRKRPQHICQIGRDLDLQQRDAPFNTLPWSKLQIGMIRLCTCSAQ